MRRLVLLLACTLAVLTLPLSPVSASTPPAAPVLTQSTATATTASFTWGTPASVSPVTRYELRRNGTLVAANLSASLTSYTFNSLTPGSTSTVLLRACSAFGCSLDSSPLTLGTAPAAPTTLAASAAPGSVQLTWSSSAQTHVWFKTSASSTWSEWTPEIPDNSPTTVTGLQNGVAYVLRVEARNAYGSSWSPFSSSTVPRDVPSRPVLVFSRATASAVTVSWTPPTTNGSSITGYKFYKDGVLVATTASVGSYTFTTLNPGSTYAFTAQACNTLGCSTESDVFHSTPLPSASMAVSTVQRDESVEVYWSSSPGASSYRLLYRPALSTTWTEWTPETADSSPTTITGLTNGTAYVFAVAALNPSGASGLALGRGTPRGSPGIPQLSLATSPSPTSAPLVWSIPSANGAPISSFKILRDGVEIASRVGSSFTVANLPAGSAPTFVVQACNVAGCTDSNTLSVQLPPQRPSVSVSRSDQSITLTWSTPTSSTATPSVWYKPTSSATWLEWTPGTPDTSPLTVSGLPNGSPYNVKLLLATSAGSVESSVLTAIPVGAPSTAPAAPTSPFSSVATVGLVWASPTDTGGLPISSFRIYRNGSLAATTSGSARNATLTSLASGSWHSLQLQVCNTSGCSPVSLAVSAATLATPPSGFSAVALGESIQLTWTNAPGDAVSGYVIQYTESTATPWLQYGSIQTSSPVTIADLTGRSINVRVCTVDKMGNRCAGTAVVVRTAQDYSPPPPRSLVASPLNGSASLTWAAPSSNPGSAILDYVIEYRPSTVSNWTQFADGSSTSTSATVSGLLNGTAYLFRVSAVNALGSGAPSASATTTPRTTPSQLAAPTATAVGSKSMTLSWDAPSSDGGAAVSGYAVYRDGSLIATVPAFPRTYDDNPLDPGTLYAYQVLALNVAGTSPFPSALVLPTLPSAPLIPTLYALPGTIEVVFDDATIEVVDYFTVFYRVADSEVTNPWLEWTPDVDDVSPTVLTGLVNGTAYDVIVAAGNASGASQSVPASATPVAPPSAPRNLVADPGTAEMELAWLSPLDDGGAPISDYEVEFSSNAGSSWSLFADGTSTATSATVTGLVAGTPYQFRTRACNATGCGVDSNIMSATTSRITPPTRTTSWEITSATLYKRNNWIWIKADTDVAHVDTAIAGLNSIDEMNESNGDAQSIWQLSVDGRPFECVQLGYNQACQAGTNQVFSGASFPLANVGLFPGSLMIWEYAGYNGMIDGVCYEYAGGSPSSSFSLQFKTPSGEYSNRFEVSCAIKTAFVPAVVGNLTTTATAGQVSLTWSAPANNGGDSISDYIVEYKSSSAVSWSLFADGTSTATTATVTGLSNGTVYVFRVAARNAIGDAAWVTSQPATPQDPISLLYPAAHFSPFSSAQTLSPTVEGSIASFSLSGDLPAGVQFDSSTGVFTGPTSWDLSAIQVSSGKSHTCAVTSVGSVKCWGDNTFGQLGDGSTTSRSVPVGVSGLTSGVLQVLASDGAGLGGRHTCALTAAGGVKCWGDNTFGQLGDGTNTNRHTPVNVLGLSTGVQQVDVGARHTCATLRTGELRCWGYNQYGSLGDGTSVDRATPVPVLNIEYVAEVSAGDAHTCARTTAGAVKCWGLNERGAVGDGSDTTRYAPVDVVGLDSGVARISLGSSYSCALTTAAAAKCWGGNASGVIGDGTTTDRYTPVNVLGLSSGVARIDAGFEHTCAVSSAGALKCWGWGDSGRLGNGSTNAVAVLEPFKVPALQSGVLQVSSGAAHTCVMLHHGSIKCFGANWTSQLGDGTSTTRTTPIQVSNFSGTTTWPATVSVTVTSTTGSTDSTNLTLYALQVGSTGPGGGTIFYTTPTSFTCGVSLNEGCTYLEAAPGTAAFFARWCATGYAYPGLNGTAVGSTDSAIGTGRLNTAVAAGTCTGGVVEYADSYVNNAHIDWFLPSADELEQMRILHLLDLDVQDAWYWSSTELVSVPFHGRVAYQTYLPYGSQYTEGFKVNGNLALPIRAGK